ncbi:ice-binding family protein [Maribacter sp. ACAM166]|uniref:ice-binding family protein n=1 Tax=Maribacter sp. ACAM166 TaxID=2508996 RepID=UPI0010FECE81|nr:ice-binding family protein [Maribacter sp. ACAM166]TLP71812.1 DUF3494 domain-containing protein [Maribacter sp. ACAM166]
MNKNLLFNLTTIVLLLFSSIHFSSTFNLGIRNSFEGHTRTAAIENPPLSVSTISIFRLADCNPAPVVDVLDSAGEFALFTSIGAVTNFNRSAIDGDIGSDVGAISGFAHPTQTDGDIYNGDTVTAQAAIDLDDAYTALMALPNTVTGHAPTFGSGETLNTGVYSVLSAGSLAKSITLDGQNDPDATFIFKFAGAFNIVEQSRVILINGAKPCNVFWIGGAGITTGAISIGAGSYVKGTFLSHGGAVNSEVGTFLQGRQLSTEGAINSNRALVNKDDLGTVITNRKPTYRVKVN